MAALTIPHLLRAIDSRRVDPEILVRCKEAHHWLRRGEVEKGLLVAQATVRLAVHARSSNKRDISTETIRRTSIGIALLYLAYLRHLSEIPTERSRVLPGAQSALMWLARDDYHHVLAQLVVARLAEEEGRMETAAGNYQDVLLRLAKLNTQQRANNLVAREEYATLRQAAQQALHQLPLVAASSAAAQFPEQLAERDWLDGVEIPAELIWTSVNLAGLQLMPVQSNEPHVAILSDHVKLLPDKLDYIEVDQVAIGGRRYQILAPQPVEGKFRMQTSQPYYAFQFATARAEQCAGQPCFALVYAHDHPLPPDWPIVILIPAEQRALLVRSQPPASPLVIGERVWSFKDGADQKIYQENDVQIVGAVVALLMPLD